MKAVVSPSLTISLSAVDALSLFPHRVYSSLLGMLDRTPIGRVVSRLSKDVTSLDDQVRAGSMNDCPTTLDLMAD